MSGISSLLMFIRAKVWAIVEWALEEFAPWLKWLVFDAILRLAVAFLMKRSERLR